MRSLEEVLGYTFQNPALLIRAMTRSAYAREAGLPGDAHMDALAVLGDAVIELAVIEAIIDVGESEKGAITNLKIQSVNMLRLRNAAEALDLTEYICWGKGERQMEIWTSGRVLAECYEALIGALYLDNGMDAVRSVLRASGIVSYKKD
ncbi:MAG: RNAse III [Methanomicrobiales archaeon 53_19]|jgi:ribonuclease-3|uniref:ribonuclease III domain-containing protein n=1 Tax=Methanocalculus sp. TaxID=2004547 RepID=UPI000746D669|nr:ribonuclease III domain-containing protein [Methanocalculus sp.]KUL01887.1 MAG: RNAse III [Methanomicrobiales archaeon 53_19]HIJ07081.1 ribonuclease III family protein [Methanocalculus sp.]